MQLVDDPSAAPAYAPGAQDLPLWRRALAQGAGYSAPSLLFLLIPLAFAWGSPTFPALVAAAILTGVFFIGASLVMHWPEWARWLWLAGLMASIAGMALITDGESRPVYFTAFVTVTAAVLIRWTQARILIVVVTIFAVGWAVYQQDLFGVVMATMGVALGLSIGLGIETERTKERLRVAEERTAVLAVAAERERIGRDLHDILGHSLTTIAVKADLAARLVGRDEAAARAEVEALGAIAREALADVRATASGMREVRLASEIASAKSVLLAAGIECTAPSALPVLDAGTSEVFGYAVREAVTNAVRHANATACVIECGDDFVSVSDNGVGGSHIEAASRRESNARAGGLSGLRERLQVAGGTLDVSSSKSGTTITARMETP